MSISQALGVPDVKRIQEAIKITASPSTGYAFPAGTPHSWLKAVCQAFPGNKNVPKLVMLHFEALRQGFLDPADYTISHLCHARDRLYSSLTDSGIRSAMKLTQGLFWELNNKAKYSCSKTEKTMRGGRPELHFRALPLDEIRLNLVRWAEPRIRESRHREWKTIPNLTPAMIDSLEGDERRAAETTALFLPSQSDEVRKTERCVRNHVGDLERSLDDLWVAGIPLDCQDLRPALFAAEYVPDVPRSYRNIGRNLGVGLGSVRKLVKRAGFQPENQVVHCPITSSGTFAKELKEACKAHHGFPFALREVTSTGEIIDHRIHPSELGYASIIVTRAEENNSAVTLILQTPSTYRPFEPQASDQEHKVPKGRRYTLVRRRESTRAPSHFGPGYNQWLIGKWLLGLQQELNRKKKRAFINKDTGEQTYVPPLDYRDNTEKYIVRSRP